jgi:hypothetical protein
MGNVTLDNPEIAPPGGAAAGGRREAAFAQATGPPARPVFVSAGSFRARALRCAGYATAALTLLWLAALIAGAIGVGRLPAVPFPAVGALSEDHASSVPQHAAPRSSGAEATPFGGSPGRRSASARDGLDRLTRSVAPVLGGRRRDVGPQRAHGGSPLPAANAPVGAVQPPPAAPQPAGAAPSSPAPAAPGRGSAAAGDHAGGRSASPPAARPVDPPPGGTSATPPATRPVDPPSAAPGTARVQTSGG